jgi:hypothetical protein
MNRRDLIKSAIIAPIAILSNQIAPKIALGTEGLELPEHINNFLLIEDWARRDNYSNLNRIGTRGHEKELIGLIDYYVNSLISHETGVNFVSVGKKNRVLLASSTDMDIKSLRDKRCDILLDSIGSYASSFVRKIKNDGIKECTKVESYDDEYLHTHRMFGWYGWFCIKVN